MDPLLPAFRRELRARAHHLHPVVAIGQHGLTPAVLHEIDVALTAHELIKVRVASDERNDREALLARICDALDCGAVQQIGKLLVLWRPRPAAAPAPPRKPPRPAKRAAAAPKPAPPAATARRRRAGVREASDPQGTPSRRRAPVGKAPSGVPRAAAPRRRRRAA